MLTAREARCELIRLRVTHRTHTHNNQHRQTERGRRPVQTGRTSPGGGSDHEFTTRAQFLSAAQLLRETSLLDAHCGLFRCSCH